jgi:hypothetical protein
MRININMWRLGFMTLVILCGGIALAQNGPGRTLVVNGKPMAGGVTELQGRTYVDLQMLSQALGATLTVEPDKITLAVNTAPAAAPSSPAGSSNTTRAASVPSGSEHLSVNFRSAGVIALGEMRQWQGAVESVIRYAVPVVGTWPQDYRDQVETATNQAKVFAITDDDQNALQLLQNNFANLRAWSDTVIADRTNLNASRFVDPDALKKDTALAKVADCSRFLGGMITSGVYSDNPNCH